MKLFGANPETTLPEWSHEDYEVAKAMRNDGKSSSEIAASFGNTRARNTVIGRLARKFGRMAPRVRNPTARAQNAAAAAERRSERQRAMVERQAAAKTPRTLAEVREKRAAEGLAIIARVEAKAKADSGPRRSQWATDVIVKSAPLDMQDYGREIIPQLPPRRYRLAADNPAFVKVEKPVDLYSHMRSERGLSDALAALTRDRKTGEIFHGSVA